MDIQEATNAWHQEIERTLLPFVKPKPKDDIERKAVSEGIRDLFFKCAVIVKDRPSLLASAFGSEYFDKAKKIRKAASLLEQTGLDFQEIIQELRRGAENIQRIFESKGRDTVRRNECVNLCREFLVSHGKHAGLGEANPNGNLSAGMAIQLAQAVLELATRNPKTGKGQFVDDRTIRKSVKRARDKTPQEKT